MTFAQPIFLYALILIPLMALFLLWAHRRKQAALARLGNLALLERLSQSVNWRGRNRQIALWFAALILLIISLARPQWGSEVEMVEQQGLQVMAVLDVSESMLAQDIKPNRLERAKLEISDLMDRLEGNELGLVLFSGAAFVQFPLTSDFATARSFLAGAQPGVISRPGTALGEAIDTALNGFDRRRASGKVMVIFTDGENHESAPQEAAQRAAEQGVLIFTVGFGSATGEPIPQYNDAGEVIGYKKDAQGQTVLSKLDEVTLQEIALASGGQYYRAGATGTELAALSAEINSLQKAKLDSRFETLRVERFQIFLLAALLAMMVAEIIPDRK